MAKKQINGIYKITNVSNGKIYIGQSGDVLYRLNCHKGLLKTGNHPNALMQEDCNEYGIDAFTFEVIEVCDIGITRERERTYIALYNSENRNCGYNIELKYTRLVLSDKSEAIYNELPQGERGKFVSDAIEEKFERQQGNSLENRVSDLEKQVKELLIERKG